MNEKGRIVRGSMNAKGEFYLDAIRKTAVQNVAGEEKEAQDALYARK